MKASSGTSGFFQNAPELEHPFKEDHILQRIFRQYLPAKVQRDVTQDLDALGSLVISPYIFSLVADAERNPPSVSTHTTFGVLRSELHTGRGWRELQAIGIRQGIVATAYEGRFGHHDRVYQFMKNHMWTPSAAMVTCPSAMTDGAARLLSKHLEGSAEEQKVFQEAFRRLTSRDAAQAWTSGQWMTERTGGSDVRGTETVATPCAEHDMALDAYGAPLGPYSISGFKWFSSATDSNMTILLAQTPSGLSAFMAPMRRRLGTASQGQTELNGIQIQRLKPKMGTTPVPTAELVLTGTRAWMVGTEGAGVREIATVLNITRVYTGLGSLGYWGRGLSIARAFARVRKVDGGKLLATMPAHLKTMAQNTVNYAAMMHLGFFTISLLGISEHPESFRQDTGTTRLVADVAEAVALLRLLTAVMKAQCSKLAIHGLQECMEALGGVGYLEDEQEYNIARLFRDCNVNAIWEGTTDVMAWDVVRVMKGREGVTTREAFSSWITRHADSWANTIWHETALKLSNRAQILCEVWINQDADELKYRGRKLLSELSWLVATVSLVSDAIANPDEIGSEIAQRWVNEHSTGSPGHDQVDWKEASEMDSRIVFGVRNSPQARL